MFEIFITTLQTTFSDSLAYLINANQRIYWLYLLSALPLAFIAFWQLKKHSSLPATGFFSYVFDNKIWWHASAKQDYLIFFINRLLKTLAIIPVLFVMAPIAIAFSDLLEKMFGQLAFINGSTLMVTLSFTTILFVFDDFSRFLLHYLLHKIPFFWEFHKVHHSAKVLTPMTIYRSHPVESFLYASRMALTQGMAVGLSYYLFGPRLAMIDIIGANLFVFIFNFCGANLRHSHVWLSWGDKLENIFISPAQHQIHHSNNYQHFDCNFGSALAVWDKMFGCLIKASQIPSPQSLQFGISKTNNEHLTVLEIYAMPFVLSAKVLLTSFISVFKKLIKVSITVIEKTYKK